jgi:prepilin-type N-terminal cleavage/methylation domain-containing protein
MSSFRSTARPSFTLVEMLVVLGIIAILAALLLPAAMGVVTRARNAAIAIELNQIAAAIESYKSDHGDYPPNFRDWRIFMQHVRKCYPKIAQTEINAFFQTDMSGNLVYDMNGNLTFLPNMQLNEGEALVFWLSHTTTDPRFCFGLTNTNVSFKKYYEFDDTRLVAGAGGTRSYLAKYCKDAPYVYIDSRSYKALARFEALNDAGGDTYAFAQDMANMNLVVRPYYSDTLITGTPIPTGQNGTVVTRDRLKPMNASSFQLLCAGQDGNFGTVLANQGGQPDPDVKQFPSGTYYTTADKDNITNFSNGKRLVDSMP